MSGRREHDTEIYTKLEGKIKDYPELVRGFYRYMRSEDHTAMTIRGYVRSIIMYTDWVAENEGVYLDEDYVQSVKKQDIVAFMESTRYRTLPNGEVKENGAGVRATRLSALLKFYDYLIDCEIITVNPCSRVKKPRDNKELPVTYLTETEINRMRRCIIASKDMMWRRDLCILTLGIRTGLRETALVEIDIPDIDFETGEIRVIEKRRLTRTVYIGDDTMRLIKEWMLDRKKILGDVQTDALFISNRRERMNQKSVWYMIKKYSKEAGIKKNITPHKMRATCATTTYKKTGDIYLTASVLGHKNLANTKRYTSIDEAKIKDITSKLDRI